MKTPLLHITRRHLQIALGCLWLLDGALQLQHQMFSSAFAMQVITPAAQGQPQFVSGPIHFAVHIFLMHPALFNSFIALVQLGLGVLILWKRTVRLGLAASVLWGLFVWAIGEGYGGVFSGQTSLLMGAPGAALLYALLALASLPSKEKGNNQPAAFWLAFVWCVTWVGGAFLQFMTGQNTTASLSAMIASNATGAPRWLAALDTHTAHIVNSLGGAGQSSATHQMWGMQLTQSQQSSSDWFVLLLVLLMVGIGLGVFRAGSLRVFSVLAGIVVSCLFWIVGQSLGDYYSGLATDPSSGPLFILLALAILGCTNLDKELARFAKKLEHIVV